MKKTIYISALVVVNLILVGSLFKIMHWPGAGILMTLGYVLFVVWALPASLINNYKGLGEKGRKWLSIVIYLVVCIVFIGALFKIMHWHGAAILMIFGVMLPFVVFLPVYIYNHNKDKDASNKNFLAVVLLLIYVAVFTVFLALGVSKNVLDNLAFTGNNITYSNKCIDQYIQKSKTDLSDQADVIYNLINKAEESLFEAVEAENEEENTENNMQLLKLPGKDNMYVARFVLMNDEDEVCKATELKNAIDDFKKIIESDLDEDPLKEKLLNDLLSTGDYYPNPEDKDWVVSWEAKNFKNIQLVSAFNNLAVIESNVRIAEMIALQSMK
jgi:flagellar basal body-associated protein FliL